MGFLLKIFMITLSNKDSYPKLTQIFVQFFKNYTLGIPHFFHHAEVYLSPQLKFDETHFVNSFKSLLLSYQEDGFWFLFEDRYLGKISIQNPFFLNKNGDIIACKILAIHSLELKNHFHLLNQRKIAVLSLVYPKKYKNQLKHTFENEYHFLFFDVLTGLKLWEYSSSSINSDAQALYDDFQHYYLHYKDDELKLRCQFISLKSPIKEFPIERMIKFLINPIHYVNKNHQKEMLEKINSVLNHEHIQVVYDDENQTIHFEKYTQNPNEKSENQIFAIDSVSAQIQDYQHKISFLFEKDDLFPILQSRLKELEIIYKNNCYLSTIVIIGSLLEALLKKKLLELGENFYKLKNLPRDTKDSSSFKPVKVLNFKEMIDIFDNNSIISKTIVNLIDSYRDFRNQIHVYHEDSKNSMNSDICEIGFRVLKMLINELYEQKSNQS